MFDATAGRQASTDKIETRSNRIAANLEDRLKELSLDDQEALMDRLDAVVASTDTTKSFVAGTYAQDSSGQPARALGSGSSTGSPTPNDLQEALNVIMAAPAATDGQKAAMTRIFFPGPDHINVESDGTPSELVSTRTQRDNEKTAKEAAVQQLADERDPNKNGSLAKQLADAQATPTAPVGMVAKADIKTAAEEALAKVKAVKVSALKGGAASKAEAEAATQAVIDLAS